jgi:hypothetical protein
MPTDSELCRSAVQVGPANGIGQPKVKWRGGPQAPQDSGPGGGDSDHDTACRELDSDSDSDSDTFKFDASLSALAPLALGWRRVAQAATAAVRGKFYAGAVQDTVTYLQAQSWSQLEAHGSEGSELRQNDNSCFNEIRDILKRFDVINIIN